MAFCGKCGKEVQEDAAFCPGCGAPRTGTAATATAAPSGGGSKVKKIVGGIVALIVVLFVIALLAPDSKNSSGAPPAAINDAAPDLSVVAERIVADYTANEVSADQKYKGKLIEVTGAVDSIGKDLFDHPYVTVGSGGEEFELTVQCALRNGQESAAAGLSKGQMVKLRGNCRGKMMNVQFDDCVVVAAGR